MLEVRAAVGTVKVGRLIVATTPYVTRLPVTLTALAYGYGEAVEAKCKKFWQARQGYQSSTS